MWRETLRGEEEEVETMQVYNLFINFVSSFKHLFPRLTLRNQFSTLNLVLMYLEIYCCV